MALNAALTVILADLLTANMSRLEHDGEHWRKRAEELPLTALRVSGQTAAERLAKFVRHRSGSRVDPRAGEQG
jgi:hypothetical protein